MLVKNPSEKARVADSFRVYDFPFRLRTNVGDAQALLAGLYRNFVAPNLNGSEQEAVLESGLGAQFSWQLGEKSGAASTLSGALWSLEAALCEAIIRSQRRLIALHAATIPVGNSAALLAASSETGKTTLSLALARRGFPAAGDDVALLEPETLTVLPIPRCFHLDDRGTALLQADGLSLPAAWTRFRFLVPDDFGVPAQPSYRARCLIFMRGPRAWRASLDPISQAEMTARLLSETGQGPLADSETIAAICRLAAGASCFKLTPGPLGETADAVAALLAGSGGPATG